MIVPRRMYIYIYKYDIESLKSSAFSCRIRLQSSSKKKQLDVF